MDFFVKLIFSLIILSPISSSAAINVGIGKSDIGSTGIHAPLFATAVAIDNGDNKIVFCNVDYVDFNSEMAQEVIQKVQSQSGLANCEILITASNGQSDGYHNENQKYYTESAVNAILAASKNLQPSKIGIGYSQSKGTSPDITLIKITTLEGMPLAAIFNTWLYPEVDARNHLQSLIGDELTSLFFNGAVLDIDKSCDSGRFLYAIWNATEVGDKLSIGTIIDLSSFEINVIVLNQFHAFITIPARLSYTDDLFLKERARDFGFSNLSLLALFHAGEMYDSIVEKKIITLLQRASPLK